MVFLLKKMCTLACKELTVDIMEQHFFQIHWSYVVLISELLLLSVLFDVPEAVKQAVKIQLVI